MAPVGSSPDAPASIFTVLAFDFGFKRIGLAAGDTLTRTAAPRPAVTVSQSGPDWAAVERELRALHPRILVVGAPYNADGTPGSMAPAARRFATELEKRFGLPVNMVDERWSSLEANAELKARRASGERRKRIRREDIDSAAAAVILERWFGGEGLLK
ncbi:MAG TPA: Holliday junction resolvase RuvX [Steroidobacteraceae bacterium]